MNNADIVRTAALAEVGSPYLYGGTGQPCTPAYRRARMEQYPEYAGKMVANCPVLSGKQSSCAGCKYQGKNAYDCAQWNRRMLEKVGVMLPSGATNQWKSDVWTEKGTIATLPRGTMCCVYKGDGSRMSHTGLYMGDGTVTDARGHDYGVLHQTLEAYGKWTHWAIPAGLEDVLGEDFLYLAEVVCSGWLNIREAKNSAEYIGKAYPGTLVQVLNDDDADWWQVRTANVTGWAPTHKGERIYLKQAGEIAPPEDEETGPEEPGTDAAAAAFQALVVAHPTLNIRAKADVQSELLGRVQEGDVLDVLDAQDATWWKVRDGSLEGYAMTGKDGKAYLKRIDGAPQEATYTVTVRGMTEAEMQKLVAAYPTAEAVQEQSAGAEGGGSL